MGVLRNSQAAAVQTTYAYETTVSTVAAALAAFTSTSYADAGPTVTVTTEVDNEWVDISWVGQVTKSSSDSHFLTLGLSVGGTDYDILLLRCTDSGDYRSGSFNIKWKIPTAGAVTIKLRAKVSNGSWAVDEAGATKTFQVTRIVAV
jgi:hypothetical protein